MTKPLAFNYGHYETLRDKANDMAIEIAELNDKVKELQKENDELKRLNEGYTKMLAKSQSTVNKLLVAGLKLQAEVNAANEKPTSADAAQGEWVRITKEYNDCDGHRAYYWYECSVCGARPPKDT